VSRGISEKTGFTAYLKETEWDGKDLRMGQISFPAFLITFLFLGFCAPTKSSYFGEENWVAVTSDGKEIKFSQLEKEQLALNVYAPNCAPCQREVPTLNFLSKEIETKFPTKAIYMVVDPYQIVPDLPADVSWGEAFAKAKKVMEKEKSDYQIQIPILFMKHPFTIVPNSLVNGTPETLLFETKPLRLYYNFIGSISEEVKAEDIVKDLKVAFFRHQFGMDGL